MMKKRNLSTKAIGSLAALCALSFFQPPALAENNFLKLGMAEFNSGNYSDASGHFGAALSTDFNSSVLHYYLGNCYVHMKQKEAAIREFRIAYALDPDKDVGKYAKQALAGLNADSPGPTGTSTANPSADAIAKAAVDKLLDLKSKPGGLTPGGQTAGIPPGGLPPSGVTPGVDPSKGGLPGTTIVQKGIDVGRGGRLFEPTTTTTTTTTGTDTASKLEALRRMYEGSRYVPTSKVTSEIQKTAENLRELMSQQAKPGSLHLVPAGTNLYIRNYQLAPSMVTQPTATTPAASPSKSSTPAH
jgi:hypothetical protein